MFDVIITVIAFICLAGMCVCMWMLHCNNKTYQQRTKIIDVMFGFARDKVEFNKLNSAYSKVSYQDHLYTLAKFRNPWDLYGDHLTEKVKTFKE
jgi:hypothetical protein